MARRSAQTRPALSTEAAIAWLKANDARRFATYDADSNTVRVWKKRYQRRADGTIIGFETAQGAWEEHFVDVREAAEYGMRQAERKAKARIVMRADVSASIASRESRIAEIRETIAREQEAVAAMSEENRDFLAKFFDERFATLETDIQEIEALNARDREWLATHP